MRITRRTKKITPAMIKTRIQVASFDDEESVKKNMFSRYIFSFDLLF